MTKTPGLTQINSPVFSVGQLNSAFTKINTAFENTLSLDGSTPNAMGADLDLNGNDIINANIVYGQSIDVEEAMIGGKLFTGSITWRSDWLTSTSYQKLDVVRKDGDLYICLEEHTSGTFSTDLSSSKWEVFISNAVGPEGPQGDPGAAGAAGQGVPTGGTTGQVLSKIDNTDYNTQWTTPDDLSGLATVATTGAYSDLSGLPTLGTASAEDVGFFATAAQGALADSALQPGDTIPWTDVTGKPTFAAIATSGSASDLSTGTLPPARLALTVAELNTALSDGDVATGGGTATGTNTGDTPPGGTDGAIQSKSGSGFAGAANAQIEGDELRLPTIATPTAPAADGVKVFGRSVAGRSMVSMMGPSGLDTTLQPHFGRNRIGMWSPLGNSGTITSIGTLAPTAVGTATAANVATTNRHTRTRRITYRVTTPSTSAVAGWRCVTAQYTIGAAAAGDGGFHLITRWGPDTGVSTATNRCFVGIMAPITPTDTEPSTRINMVGVGWDAADTNIQIMHNDGSGTATKIDLGASFPVPTVDQTSLYEIALFSRPGTTQAVDYEFTDLVSGDVATGTITTDIPSTTTLISPHGWMSVGGTSSVIGIAMASMYIETDM